MLALPAFSYLHVVKYTKPALSLDAPRALLTERGLRINSEALLRKLLRDYGFARLDSILMRVDDGMYRSKAEGRDRITYV